jgi:hypothetical protein
MNALVIDLDGTLLHPEEEAIKVPGRSGYAYFSGRAAEILQRISCRIPVVIATARNNHSVSGMVRQLPEVNFAGFVMENGLVSRRALEADTACDPVWNEVAAAFPGWERLRNYEQCFGAVVPEPERDTALDRLNSVLRDLAVEGYTYAERHKIFACKSAPNKLAGLRRLSVTPYIVLGNDWNDLEVMEDGTHAAVLADAAPEARLLARAKRGYESPWSSHRGTIDVLLWVDKMIRG